MPDDLCKKLPKFGEINFGTGKVHSSLGLALLQLDFFTSMLTGRKRPFNNEK